MGLSGRDIVCLSTHFWDERRFRKQEFMTRFGRENRVLFVEPSFSMARRAEAHLRELATNRYLMPKLERRSECLYLFKPPRGLPKWSAPRVEKLTYRWFARQIGNVVERLNFRDVILWVYRPAYYNSLDLIPHRKLVFDMVDDLAAYEVTGTARSDYVEQCVLGLVRQSDLLVVTAKTLFDRYKHDARRIVHVPNGFDAKLFSNFPKPEMSPLGDIPRPILGFVGTLFNFLDFELLEAVARFHSDKSLVLIGPVETNAREAVARLSRLPNVFHLGGKPQGSIPKYIAAFDVCLNPFRKTRVADSVNPLKVYEYLAMGRPVVSTPMEALQLEEVAAAVAFASDDLDFCRQVDLCLRDEVQFAARAREEAAAPYSWDSLFERLDAACEETLKLL